MTKTGVTFSRPTQFQFEQAVSSYVDVVGLRLGGKIVAFSDEWFASASNLIEPGPPVHQVGKFTDRGAWYDGWETRRHNPEVADWVIIRVGVTAARIIGAEVDTANFNGNHAPAISVEGVFVDPRDEHNVENAEFKDVDWEPIIPERECGPSSRHFFLRSVPTEQAYTHIRLSMYPDGGIARFRLFGTPVPVFPTDPNAIIDLAHVSNGGVAISWSDKHFSSPDNLLISGRGHDMSDGWETARSRVKGHVDWIVVRLGAPGHIERIVVDTAYYLGNYPTAVRVEGFNAVTQGFTSPVDPLSNKWELIVPETKTGPHKEHEYTKASSDLTVSDTDVYTHIKLTIIPDGGVKRLRVFGRRAL